jgi:phage FluMu gp28-like protein
MKVQLKIKNFPAQQEIFDDPHKYKVVAKGRRFGLTKGAANDFIKCALERKFKRGLWVDTVNVNIDRYIERYFMPHLRQLPQNMWERRVQDKIIYILDSYIDFRSVDRPENIEGFGYDKAFLNEAGIILNNEYLWHNAISPMLLEFKPQTVIGGTPKGKNMFWELAQRGQDKEQELYTFLHYTTFDNPYLDGANIRAELKGKPEAVVKQEYYAEFLDDFGAVFRNFLQVMTALPAKPISGHLYVMGVDLAKVQDYTVITVYDRATNTQVYQDRFQDLSWPFQKKKIASIAKHYNNALVYMDATGVGDPIVDDLARQGISIEPVKFTNQNKAEMIEKLVIWIEQEKLRMIKLDDSILEFSNFTYEKTKSGKVLYTAPEGFHDDIVISHALAVHGLHLIPEKSRPESKTRLQKYYETIKNPADDEWETYEV